VTPVAIVEPVSIAGIVINRATLHNRAFIQQKKIKIGCLVNIERSADVIPKITSRADLPPEVQGEAATKKSTTAKKTTKEPEREIDEKYEDGVNWSVCPCAIKSPLVRMGTQRKFPFIFPLSLSSYYFFSFILFPLC